MKRASLKIWIWHGHHHQCQTSRNLQMQELFYLKECAVNLGIQEQQGKKGVKNGCGDACTILRRYSWDARPYHQSQEHHAGELATKHNTSARKKETKCLTRLIAKTNREACVCTAALPVLAWSDAVADALEGFELDLAVCKKWAHELVVNIIATTCFELVALRLLETKSVFWCVCSNKLLCLIDRLT